MRTFSTGLITSLALVLMAHAAQSSASAADTALELRYSGELAPVGRNGVGAASKGFSLYTLVSQKEEGRRDVVYVVDERGGGGWSWPERFGFVGVDPTGGLSGASRPQLLHDHDGLPHPVALPFPVFGDVAKLKSGAEWKQGKFAFSVGKRERVADRDCWAVDVANNFGRVQTLWIDARDGVLVQANQKVFMGRGDEFQLKLKLESSKTLDAPALAKLAGPIDTLRQLKDKVARKENETKPELNEAQLKTASAVLDKLEKEADETPFARLSSAIIRDVKSQSRRTDDVADLAKRFVGRPAPEFSLKGLNGEVLDAKERKDKIVVLHFWEYQGEPLSEPYGQVGYLDFLNGKRKKLGVQIYGVAVDPRFGDANNAPLAARSVRKLQSFMNLDYPITADDGRLLKKFGDPRALGSKLPLWVVIAPDGKVAAYRAGIFQIKPDEGLRELDAILIEQIRQQRGRATGN